jgi:tryptophan 2,3-dioxygenase
MNLWSNAYHSDLFYKSTNTYFQDMSDKEKNNEIDPLIIEKIRLLKEKYEASGQDLSMHLDGLLHSEYFSYWRYIQLDALLSLQNQQTEYPDEMVFLIYHQITELYFKLILNELYQICSKEDACDAKLLIKKVGRVNNYLKNLITSFDLVMSNMDREQFLKFRLALIPASGFQSVQYRMIEIIATNFKNLVSPRHRPFVTRDTTIEEMFPKVYWKEGSIEVETGKKTLTLEMFEQKYNKQLLSFAREYRYKNLCNLFNKFIKGTKDESEAVSVLREFDTLMNVDWPLAHYRSAVKYLQKNQEQTIAATGGTNWQKYLPPKYQLNIFYPDLWTQEELEHWGKGFKNRPHISSSST